VKIGDVACTLIVLAILGVNIGITCKVERSAAIPDCTCRLLRSVDAAVRRFANKLEDDCETDCKMMDVFKFAFTVDVAEALDDRFAPEPVNDATIVAVDINAAPTLIAVESVPDAEDDAFNTQESVAEDAPPMPIASPPIVVNPDIMSP
jgi:hypothetical protein